MTQLLKFILVGGMNTAFGYGVFALFIALGVNATLSLLLATCCGILFNFKSIGSLVFDNGKNTLFLKFIVLYLAMYVVNVISIHIIDYFIHNWYLSGIITVAATAGLNFIGNKKYVFADSASGVQTLN